MDVGSAASVAASVQSATLRQDLSVSMLRQAATADQAAVKLLDTAAQSAPPSGGRGSVVDIRA